MLPPNSTIYILLPQHEVGTVLCDSHCTLLTFAAMCPVHSVTRCLLLGLVCGMRITVAKIDLCQQCCDLSGRAGEN